MKRRIAFRLPKRYDDMSHFPRSSPSATSLARFLGSGFVIRLRAANRSSIVRSGRFGAEAQPMTVVQTTTIIAASTLLATT